MKLFVRFVASVVLSIACSTSGAAAIRVHIGDAQISAGGTGFVDVTATGEGDLLSLMGAEFRITPVGGALGTIAFVDPPIDDHLSDSSYVFLGDSTSGGGNVSSVNTVNDTYIGGDGTDSGLGVLLSDSDPKLLFRLWLTTSTLTPPQVGEVFLVQLDFGASTVFLDDDFVELPYSSTSGMVTIAAEPVPEPSALLLFAGTLLSLPVLRRQNRVVGSA